MTRRSILALLMLPFGQQLGSVIWTDYSNNNNWEVTIPDKLTIKTKDGWTKTFTHDEIKRILDTQEATSR